MKLVKDIDKTASKNQEVTDKQAEDLFNDIKQDQLAIVHECIVELIKEALLLGLKKRAVIVDYVYDDVDISKRSVGIVLDEYEGKLWKMTRGPNRSKVYSII